MKPSFSLLVFCLVIFPQFIHGALQGMIRLTLSDNAMLQTRAYGHRLDKRQIEEESVVKEALDGIELVADEGLAAVDNEPNKLETVADQVRLSTSLKIGKKRCRFPKT